jgi:hypothetical protein
VETRSKSKLLNILTRNSQLQVIESNSKEYHSMTDSRLATSDKKPALIERKKQMTHMQSSDHQLQLERFLNRDNNIEMSDSVTRDTKNIK